MAIDMKLLNGFVWEHFKRFVASNPANADFPETHIEQKDGVVTILHKGVDEETHNYMYHLPAEQGVLQAVFKIEPEWDAVVCEWIQSANIRLLQDYSEYIGEFIAGVPYDIDFTEEELAKLDAARELTGMSREEFIHAAITTACDDLSLLEDTNEKCSAAFVRKLKEKLGDGSVVLPLSSNGEVDVFVAGVDGSGAYINRLIEIMSGDYGNGCPERAREFCRNARKAETPAFELYYCAKSQSPLSNINTQDDWVMMISENLNIV